MATEQTNKHGLETVRPSSPQFAASSWVEELAKSWERRAKTWDMQPHYSKQSCRTIARELQTCIKELRAYAESSSTESSSATPPR